MKLRTFRKAYRCLNAQSQTAVDKALNEILNSDNLPSGRCLKKVKSRKDTWAIRISKGIRLSLEVKNGTCILRNVGDHDKILDDP